MSEMSKVEKCKNSVPDIENGKVTFCCCKSGSIITNDDCEKCKDFKSRYIEYPIEVKSVQINKVINYGKNNIGKPVRIQPCAEKYNKKTYFGIFLGDLVLQNTVSYRKDIGELTVMPITNPAIFVPELKEIIYGAESWWSFIKDKNELTDITSEEINNQWYMQLLHGLGNESEE